MPILVIFAVVGIVYILQKKIYQKYWNKNLKAEVDFTDRFMFERESTVLTETITNAKKLPLPWIHVKFQISKNGKVTFYRSDMFSILFYQQIRRRIPYTFKERGVYTIKGVDLVSHNLFVTDRLVQTVPSGDTLLVYPERIPADEFRVPYEKMIGEIITKRCLMEDPYMFKGIREYQPYDSFRSINFNASARAGQWMVNTQDPTVSQTIHILLNMEKGTEHYNMYLYEQSIRLAASMAAQYEEEGVPVSVYCNGMDYLTKSDITVEAGCGSGHTHSVFEAMARLDVPSPVLTSMAPELEKALKKADPDTLYVLISPYYGEDLKNVYQELRSYTTSCMWILPVSYKDMSDPDFTGRKVPEEIEDVYLWEN